MPRPFRGRGTQGAARKARSAHVEDVKSSSCSMFTPHNNPFGTQGSPQDHGSTDDGRSALEGPIERDATWSEARTVPTSLTSNERERVLRMKDGEQLAKQLITRDFPHR